MRDRNVPILDEDGDDWVLKVHGAGPVRVPKTQRALALHIMEAATRAYANGRSDKLHEVQQALGLGQ